MNNEMLPSRLEQSSHIILSSVAITVALIYTRSILVPFILAVCAYIVLSSAINFVDRKIKLPGWLTMSLVVGFFLLCTFSLVYSIVASIEQFVSEAYRYREKVSLIVEQAANYAGKLGFEVDAQALKLYLSEFPILELAKNITGNVIGITGNVFLIAIIVLFMLMGRGKNQVRSNLVGEIQLNISRYLATKAVMSLATGALFGTTLAFFRVDLTLMFAILAVLLNFIPSIGSIISVVLPVPVVLLQYGFGWELVVIAGIGALINFIIGNIIEPKLMGESLDLHPVTIILFLLFWGLVWGPIGMFLAVPITAILKIVLSRIPATREVSELLAGRI